MLFVGRLAAGSTALIPAERSDERRSAPVSCCLLLGSDVRQLTALLSILAVCSYNLNRAVIVLCV